MPIVAFTASGNADTKIHIATKNFNFLLIFLYLPLINWYNENKDI